MGRESGECRDAEILAMFEIEVKRLLRKYSVWLTRVISSGQSSFALFICLLTIVFVYRIQLAMGLFTSPVRPFDFNPAHTPVWLMLTYWPYDLALVLFLFLLSWYFPTKFIKNSGIQEIHSYENLKFKIKEEFHSLGHYIARDEIQTVDFFIQRMSKAREPFLGIYISFAAHFPYFDYGENYRIMKEDGRLINRYYNNLNLLDHMIKRIVDHLKGQGLLERTILVIVGDHGQAFGQHHPNNFMHYRYSYNENLETPAIFYQPALFKPKTFEFPTSHVDILPTLLDALRIPYPPMVFNGESLFHYKLRQESIFFYGYEESVSSLDPHLIKVQYSLKKNKCWAFDLKHDPDEKNPLDCCRYPLQREALHKFVSDHDEHLLKYNTSLKEKGEISEVQVPIVKD